MIVVITNVSTMVNVSGREISQFERDVGAELLSAGFWVLYKYEVAGKFIDLVVEDRKHSLAVECDCDESHGPDQCGADMARQHMLEHCGWKFIRIRSSVFYANWSKAVGELIDAIRAHGIEPHAITDEEAVLPKWVEEVSGNQCMEALGAYTVDTAEENAVPQREPRSEESEETKAYKATSTTPRATAAEASTRQPAQIAMPPEQPFGEDDLLAVVACLKAASEPLKRSQILWWRTKIDAEKWVPIIAQLIRRGLVVQTGTTHSPRYALYTGDSQTAGQERVITLNPVGVQRLLDALALEVPETATPHAPPTTGNSPSIAEPLPQQLAHPRTTGETPPPEQPLSIPSSTGSISWQQIAASIGSLDLVSVDERKAILTALDKAGEPLIMWKLSESSKIDQRRMEKILPLLVSEGSVKRVEAVEAVRYSRA